MGGPWCVNTLLQIMSCLRTDTVTLVTFLTCLQTSDINRQLRIQGFIERGGGPGIPPPPPPPQKKKKLENFFFF